MMDKKKTIAIANNGTVFTRLMELQKLNHVYHNFTNQADLYLDFARI